MDSVDETKSRKAEAQDDDSCLSTVSHQCRRQINAQQTRWNEIQQERGTQHIRSRKPKIKCYAKVEIQNEQNVVLQTGKYCLQISAYYKYYGSFHGYFFCYRLLQNTMNINCKSKRVEVM